MLENIVPAWGLLKILCTALLGYDITDCAGFEQGLSWTNLYAGYVKFFIASK